MIASPARSRRAACPRGEEVRRLAAVNAVNIVNVVNVALKPGPYGIHDIHVFTALATFTALPPLAYNPRLPSNRNGIRIPWLSTYTQ